MLGRRHHDPEVLALTAAHRQMAGSEDGFIRNVGVLYGRATAGTAFSVKRSRGWEFNIRLRLGQVETGVIVQVATARLRSENSEAATSFRDTLKF